MNKQNNNILYKSANTARALAIDAVCACNSGHLGLPLGSAEIGAVLFGEVLNITPSNSKWINRDRFVLSGGHGSMFLYSWLHLSGFKLSLEDLSKFRVKASLTPGHPEFNETDGVEATTGPLGQGIANAVGMALSEKMAEAVFNTDNEKIFDNTVYCLAGDGCFQEGISAEASSLAGMQNLDNLILIYDSNNVTLDAPLAKTMLDDTKMRYQSYSWQVFEIDGHNIDEIRNALKQAKQDKNGKPKLIIAKTIIGKGISQVQGTPAAHGEGGAKFAKDAKISLGLDGEKSFQVSQDIYEFFEKTKADKLEIYNKWVEKFDSWKKNNPQLNQKLQSASNYPCAMQILNSIDNFGDGKTLATRTSGGTALNQICKDYPLVISGSADLHGSTKNYIKDGGDFSSENQAGKNIYFGIREHAMGAILNGFAYYGIFKASGATFLTFVDYMRPSIRVAALAKLPVFYILTHDSIGVGFDGPTHQPVELVSSLRCIPNLNVIRPADAQECSAAFAIAVASNDCPTALILSRQDLPDLSVASAQTRRNGTLKGAYIIKEEQCALEKIIIATGSELSLALEVADGQKGVRVVSMPCMEIFEKQSDEYKQSILPSDFAKGNIFAIEAGITGLWHKYAGKAFGTDTFGFSADGPIVYEAFGLTSQNLKKEIFK